MREIKEKCDEHIIKTTPFGAYKMMWKKYYTFNGITGRKDYWYAMLIHIAIQSILFFLLKSNFNNVIMYTSAIITIVYFLISFVPSIAISVRRLHDTGRSGWWLLLCIVGFIGGFVCLVYLCGREKTIQNKFRKDDSSMKENQINNNIKTICKVLEDKDIHYETALEDNVIHFGYSMNGINSRVIIRIDSERNFLEMLGVYAFDILDGKINDISRAVCLANIYLAVGFFKYDMNKHIIFKLSQIFADNAIEERIIEQMLLTLLFTLNDYADKFFAVNNGYISAEQINDNQK